MQKRFFNAAIVYAILAMVGGVFFREYTKYMQYTGDTNLSVIHAHYFMLGMFFFLVLALLDKAFAFAGRKGVMIWVTVYHVGLNLTVACLFLRGLAQMQPVELSAVLDASLSGVAGIGHIILGTGILVLLILIRKSALAKNG